MNGPGPDASPHLAGRIVEPAPYRPPGGVLPASAPRLPWTRVAVGVVLAVVLWAVWYVLTARSVGIEPRPAQASVNVDEWPAVRIGNHWLLRPGARRVSVEAPGHVPFRGEIEVSAKQLQTHRIALERLPGHLRVAVVPHVEAELLVDGKPGGKAPGRVENVPAGLHDITVRAPRYLDFETTLDIEGKGIEQRLDVKLEPAWATVTLASEPPGATIAVDGKPQGTTPAELELLNGRRVLDLSAPGYKPWRQTLTVIAGNDVDLGAVVMAKADGLLELSSTPEGANVTLDGEFRGLTPLELPVSPDEAHTVQLIKQGYKTGERKVELESSRREKLHVELEPELAVIHFRTTPAEAEMLIDGELVGNATRKVELATHEHTIVVRAPGFATFETSITPRKGAEKRYRIRLRTVAEMADMSSRGKAPASGAPAQRMVKTHAGQELKLFTGGTAMLGSGRKAPGHRDNEPQRSVTLERPFYLGLKEVTNGEFRQFLATHESGEANNQQLDDARQPVVNVSWQTAALYCNWLSRRDGLPPFYQIRYGEVLGVNPNSTGYRLPTEAEWEWAARVPPQGDPTVYPWGNRFPPRGRSGNFAGGSAASAVGARIEAYDDGFGVSAPVGSFPPNLRGIYDLDGNVAEWVHDVYDASPASAQGVDPMGPAAGEQHVVKGGSWASATPEQLRAPYRTQASAGAPTIGFRIARYAR